MGAGLFDLQRKRGVARAPGLGLHGLPQITAQELLAPKRYQIRETSLENWTELYVPRPANVRAVGARRTLRAIPNALKMTGAQHISSGEFIPSERGILPLPAPGTYWLSAEIVTAENTAIEVVYQDALIPITDADDDDAWAAKFDPRVMLAPATAAVTNASANKVAARVDRRYLYIRAYGFAGGCTKVALAFGSSAAEATKGIQLAENEWVAFDALDGVTEQAVQAITDAGTASLAIQEAT